jgi:hypothetical protein
VENRKSPESLPPTSDALKLHIERAHFQASVWKQANVVKPVLPSPVTMGWSLDGDRLIPIEEGRSITAGN